MTRRLLFVLPDLAEGGAQPMNLRLIRELRGLNWDVHVAVLFDRGCAVRQSLLDGVPFKVLGANDFARKLVLPLRLAKVAKNADVVVGGMEFAATNYGFAAAMLAHRPFLSWTHTSFSHHQTTAGPLDRLISYLVYRRCRYVVFPSQGAKVSLQTVLGAQPATSYWHVIENFIDHPSSLPGLSTMANTQLFSRPVIIGIGRLVKVKAFDRLIRAHAALLMGGIDHHLLILGDGPQRAELLALAEKLGVAGTVFMPGHVSEPYLWLPGCQVFALCSRYEGLPLALLEALAAGVPCVAMDCPSGPREILHDGEFGLLTPPDDESALANAIGRLLTDAALQDHFARRGSQRAKDYTADRIMPQWEALLTELVASVSR